MRLARPSHVDRALPRSPCGPAARRPSPAKAHLQIWPAASSSTHRAKPMGELTPAPSFFYCWASLPDSARIGFFRLCEFL